MAKTVIEYLIKQGIVSEAVVNKSLQNKKPAEMPEEALMRDGLIDDVQLARAYGAIFKAPVFEAIQEKLTDADILGQVPFKFLRDNAIIPLKLEDGKVAIVISSPTSLQAVDDLKLVLGAPISIAFAPRAVILEALNRYYPLEGTKEVIQELEEESAIAAPLDFESIQEEDILGMAQEAPIIKLVNQILYQAVKRGASDIHIEPYEKDLQIRYRIDGILYPVMAPPKRTQAAITSRLKIMANLNIAEKRQPQDGRIQIRIADKPIDIRVSVLPVTYGERIVLRLLDKTKTFGKLKELGFSEHDYKMIEASIAEPNGIIFITGPTGSGKTSTLYSILSEVSKPDVNIITVEDPVEYQMQGVGQVQVKEKIGLTFAAALRSILRQDPDIIMIGETRDNETAQIATQAALTGHLVLSTLHTNNAPSAITRLIDMGIEPFLIASTIISIVAQRLVRRLCPKCKIQYEPTQEVLERIGLTKAKSKHITFYKAVGCEECNMTGYKGRLAIFEVMKMTPEIARLTVERSDTSLLEAQARKDGMTTLLEDGLRKIEAGITTIEEVLSVATMYDALEEE
jgi:type II secretion system protein E